MPDEKRKSHRHTYTWELLDVDPNADLQVVVDKSKQAAPARDAELRPCNFLIRGSRSQQRCLRLWQAMDRAGNALQPGSLGSESEAAGSSTGGRPLLLRFLRGYKALADSGFPGLASAFPPLAQPPPGAGASRDKEWSLVDEYRRDHEKKAEVAVVMTSAVRHIVSLPSVDFEGWHQSGGIPLGLPYRVLPDARHPWEVAAACDEDPSCEGFTPDGRLFRWMGIGNLASMHSKSEKSFARPVDAWTTYSELQQHLDSLPRRILEAGE